MSNKRSRQFDSIPELMLDMALQNKPKSKKKRALKKWRKEWLGWILHTVHDDFTKETIPTEVVQMTVFKRYTLLKAWRIYRRLKQTELAAKIGITWEALSEMEKSHTPPRAILEKISKILDVDVNLLTDANPILG